MTQPRQARHVAAALSIAVLALAACDDEQRRDIEGAAIALAIDDATRAELDDAGVDDLDCEADIAQDSIVSGTCTGTTTDGAIIETTLSGRLDVDSSTCASQLAITLDGQLVAEDTDFDCLDG